MVTRTNHTESGFTLIEVIVTFVLVAFAAAMMVTYFGTAYRQSSNPFIRLNKAATLSKVMETISAQYNQYPHWRPNTTYLANAIVLPTTPNRTGMLYQTASGGTSAATEPNWLSANISDNGFTWVPYDAAPMLVFQDWQSAHTYLVDATIVHNNYVYVTRTGGTSGTTTLTWLTAIGSTVPESTGVTWTCSGGPVTVSFIPPISPLQLQTKIGAEGTDQDNQYGKYSVIYNRFVKFDATNTEQNIDAAPNDPLYGWYLKVAIGFRSDDPNRTAQTLTTLFVLR